MLAFVFILPLIAALLCLFFNQAASTRWLGIGAAASLIVCGAAVLIARLGGLLPLALLDYAWVALESGSIRAVLRLDAANWWLALLALGGGGLALLALALALPATLRGFGGLFAAAVAALLATVAGLAIQSAVLLPLAWAAAGLLVFLALRASGALAGSDAPLVGLLSTLCGALILLGAALLAPVVAPAALMCWALVGLLALGTPPFHAPVQDLAAAPAALSAALLPLGLPLIGGYALIRFLAAQDAGLPSGWRLALTLLGLAALIICAAGATGTTRLRQALGWQLSAQMGLVIIAAGQGGPVFLTAALALLANAALALLACFLAVAVLERRAGTDDIAAAGAHEPLALPGLVFLIGAVSAVGLPGAWGLWPRLWLIGELMRAAPWAVPPLLAGSALSAAAFVAPLASFWRRSAPGQIGAQPAPALPLAQSVVCAAGAAPLLILGVAPQLAWDGWLAGAQSAMFASAPAAPPPLPAAPTQVVCGLAALGLVALPLAARLRGARACPPEGQPALTGVFATQALGESLRGLAWAGAATRAFALVWAALLGLGRLARRGLALFEQRYYLAGLLIAVIIVIMLFMQ